MVARKLQPAPLDRAHHCASVRGYYENVAGAESGMTEFFLTEKYLQGYLWIFPVGAGRCNVGLGMLSETVARHKVDLKQLLPELLATHPALAGRFASACRCSSSLIASSICSTPNACWASPGMLGRKPVLPAASTNRS